MGRVLFFKDDGAMSLVHTHELDPKELGLSCTIYNCPAVEGVREAQQLFVIGTAQVVGGEAEPSRGRILVFAVSYTMGQQQLMDAGVTVTLVHALPVNGAVLSLTSTLHFVVAGVGNKVQ